jgi:hypothetical protein
LKCKYQAEQNGSAFRRLERAPSHAHPSEHTTLKNTLPAHVKPPRPHKLPHNLPTSRLKPRHSATGTHTTLAHRSARLCLARFKGRLQKKKNTQ